MVIIIGGGITGLSAAYELTVRGVPFVLLEASARAGGLIRTERIDGFTVDAGPDSILAQKPAAIRLCEELGLGDRLIGTKLPRRAYVLKHGRLHPLPSPSVLGLPTTLEALTRYDLLSWRARARLAIEPLIPRGAGADESVAAFFSRRFGRETVHLVADPLLGGIHAGRVDELSVRSLFPRLVEAEQKTGGVLRNLTATAPRGPLGLFRALRSGMGELVDALLWRLPGDAVRLGMRVRELHRGRASWRIAGDAAVFDAAAVIVAAPAFVAAALLRDIDSGAAEICATVPYVSTASVALGWRREDVPHPLAGSGFVVARRYNALRMTACTWVSSKWEGRAPEGYALLRVFLGGAHDPDVSRLEEPALVDLARREVSQVLGITAPAVVARAFRSPMAGAQHVVGHADRMARLGARLRELPGLFVAGSGFESIGIPDCVAHGRSIACAAADHLAHGGGR